jgi:hypothetical protein
MKSKNKIQKRFSWKMELKKKIYGIIIKPDPAS